MNDMRVLVTGGAGFIGANLVHRLAAHSDIDHVVVLDDLSTGQKANLDGVGGVTFIEASVCDVDALAAATSQVDAVIHLAARPSVPRSINDPVASHEANATGTLRVLEAARAGGAIHTVVASSSSVYGRNPTLPKHEELATLPLSPYAVSKLATEGYALAYQASYGLPTLALRFFNVFGPYQSAGHAYAAAIPSFLDAALAGRPLTVHGDGNQTRDFTFVGSVCSVLIDAVIRRVVAPTPVNLAFGTRHTILDVISSIERLLGLGLRTVHTEPRPGDIRDSQADATRLHELFPYVEAQDFYEGLRTTVEWFRGEV